MTTSTVGTDYLYLSMKSIQFIFFIIFLRGGFGEGEENDDDGAMEESIIQGKAVFSECCKNC